jgi:hypothetical protein
MQPAEAELVAGSEQDDNRSDCRDFRKRESELKSRVSGLTCLGARWKVSTGDQIEPTGRRTLTIRHISIVDDRRASAPARLRKPFSADLFAGSSPVKTLPKPVGGAADMVANSPLA